jgi:hypothetical protein
MAKHLRNPSGGSQVWGDPYGRVECSRRGEFPLSEAVKAEFGNSNARSPVMGQKMSIRSERVVSAWTILHPNTIFVMPYHSQAEVAADDSGVRSKRVLAHG